MKRADNISFLRRLMSYFIANFWIKKNTIFFGSALVLSTASSTAQQCQVGAGSSIGNSPHCDDAIAYYANGTAVATLQVNFIFVMPLNGASSTFDNYNSSHCQIVIDSLNAKFSNLSPPTRALPNPAPLVTDTKIRFILKNIHKISHSAHGVDESWPSPLSSFLATAMQ